MDCTEPSHLGLYSTRKIVSQISFQIQLISQTVPFKLAELSVTESSAASPSIHKETVQQK